MRADLQNRIAPPVPVEKTENKYANNNNQVIDSNANEDIDFRSLVYSSSENAQKAREAQKKGLGLDASTSDQEFFDNLRKQTNQRPTPKSNLDKNDFMKLFVAQKMASSISFLLIICSSYLKHKPISTKRQRSLNHSISHS